MRDISDADDLLATAREALLAEVLPALPKEARYVALMIANVMAIAAREHRLGLAAMQNEAARLSHLLDAIDTSFTRSAPVKDLAALRQALRAAIRAGHFDAPGRTNALIGELLDTASEWLAISNPKALAPASTAPHRPERAREDDDGIVAGRP
jgi:arginine/ornithine N-succinyltransferase beta subunit